MKLGRTKSEGTYFMINPEDNTVTKLPESSLEKDLGVLVDDQLTFKEHIATATAKANRVLGVIRRSFQHLEIDTFIDLYKSLVRPILEYGHSVWQPHLKGLRRDLEDAQRRATRMVANLRQLTYPQRLEALQLPSLEHRRRRGDMIDTYKYMQGIYDTKAPRLKPATYGETRGNSRKLFVVFATEHAGHTSHREL